MSSFGFSGRYKLKKTDEFSSVFNFRKRISSSMITLHYMPNQLGHARMGLVVSKKIAKRAVARNYMKRALREFFRLNQKGLRPLDILLRPTRSFERAEYPQLKIELAELFHRLASRG